MLDWDDLRYALAIARHNGLAGAARALGADHSTVFRHLNALEAELGAQLFERLATGYRLTAAGERLRETAERMEADVIALDRELAGRDTRLTGMVRVTASETLAFRLLTAAIARFRLEHPGIEVELTIDNRALDLSRREADVALRAARPSQPDLFGRRLADLQWAVYASADYIARHGSPAHKRDMAGHSVLGWAEGAQGISRHRRPRRIGLSVAGRAIAQRQWRALLARSSARLPMSPRRRPMSLREASDRA